MLAITPTKPLAARNVRSKATLTHRHTTAARLSGGNGSSSDRGGAVLDRPGFLTGDRSSTPDKESGRGSKQGDGGRGMGGGSHRVLLLDSPNHTEKAVVDAILTVIPGTDPGHAANCFHTSRSLGMALVTTALLEIAEFYSQELYRRGCRNTIEPDTTTL